MCWLSDVNMNQVHQIIFFNTFHVTLSCFYLTFCSESPGLEGRQLNEMCVNSYVHLDAPKARVGENVCGDLSPSLSGRINHMRKPSWNTFIPLSGTICIQTFHKLNLNIEVSFPEYCYLHNSLDLGI
jgi:hypothetical protein